MSAVNSSLNTGIICLPTSYCHALEHGHIVSHRRQNPVLRTG